MADDVQGTLEAELGETLQRLRRERGISLEELGRTSDLSPSFLSAVERGRSDISLGRLSRVARAFGFDVSTLLGYYSYRTAPRLMTSEERRSIDRGEGVDYQRIRLPGVNFELVTVTFQPHTAFRDAITHPGIDIVYVPTGEVVLTYDGHDYVLRAGDSGVWPGAHPHTFRNDTDEHSQFVAVVTETVWDRG